MKKLSTVVYVLFIVAAAVAAPTANEDFVIAEDAQTYTNAVNAANAYTDAATNAIPRPDYTTGNTALVETIEATAPAPGDYVSVSNRAMNALPATARKIGTHTHYTIESPVNISSGLTFASSGYLSVSEIYHPADGILTVPYGKTGDIATTSDIADAAISSTNYTDAATNALATVATSGSYDDLANTPTIPRTAADVGAYSAANGATLAAQVATIGAHLNAEDARFVVTNYNSVTHTPEAYVEIKLPDDSWSRIWSEMTRWNYLYDFFLPTNYYDKAAVNAALNDKADRAWGFYDSTTGEYAPDGYTWISSEKIAIAANLAYQRTITTEGAIWVLESNGVVTETGGMTNGFFRISDDEGNSLFEIVKGSKRTIGADASSCQVVAGFTPTKLQIGYSVVGPQPVIYVCNSLVTQNWKAETESDCIANVSWSGESGAWVAQVQGKTAQSALFVKATYEVGGETYINNTAPVSMQYIMLNGVKYAVGTATISGNTVLTLTAAP